MLKRVVQCLLVAALSVLAGCDKGVPEMNAQEQQTVQDYINAMAPVCIGRFMMDVPEQMELAYSFLKVNDATISARPMSRQMFERHLAKRQRELENMEYVDPEDAPFLKNVLREEDRVIFDRNEDTGTYDSGRVLEGYRFSDNMMFEVSIKATDLSDDKYADWRTQLPHNKPGRLHQVRYLLGQLRPLRRGEIPDAPGVCFENGFLALEAEQDMPGHAAWFPIERVTMRFIDRERRDVYFNITTDSWSPGDGTTLLDRVSDIRGALRHDDNGAVLRTGEVALQGIDQAAEVLSVGTSQSSWNEIRQNYFYLEANSLKGNRLSPLVAIKLVNGEFAAEEDDDKRIDRASLTDAEAAGLWDAVTRTFRPRPGAF